MDTYTLALVGFGLVFSGLYWKEANITGKVITVILILFHFMQLGQLELNMSYLYPSFVYVYALGNLGALIYAWTQRHLDIIQKLVISTFSVSIFTAIIFNELNLISDYQIITYIPLVIFGYVFYRKEDFEKELSFLNLSFIQSLMGLIIILNSSYN